MCCQQLVSYFKTCDNMPLKTLQSVNLKSLKLSQHAASFSELRSEQFSDSEAPDSSKPTPSTSSVTFNSKERPRTSKIWDYTPGAHDDSFTILQNGVPSKYRFIDCHAPPPKRSFNHYPVNTSHSWGLSAYSRS